MTTLASSKAPRRLVYVSGARIPTARAHGLQIMLMCAAFARAGLGVELVVPDKRRIVAEDPFEYYRIARTFSIRRLASLDLIGRARSFYSIAFLLDVITFVVRLSFSRIAQAGDVVYCRDYPVLFALSPRRNPLVFEVHDIPRSRFLFRRALARASLVVAITHAMKDDLVALGVVAERIVVSPDAVDLEDFAHPQSQADARHRLGLPLDKKVALYVGRIDGWKGTDTFFVASELLSDDVLSVVIGGEAKKIESLAARYSRVRFLGSRPYHELADNMAAADVLVLPNSGKFDISARYTSPLKLFAYMTSGKPIVASDLPSIREVIDDTSAYMVLPDDPAALAESIGRALSDSDARVRAGRAQNLVNGYTWEQRARRILDAVPHSRA